MRVGDIGIVKVDSGWIPIGTRVKILFIWKQFGECLVENVETGYTAQYKINDVKITEPLGDHYE